MNQEVYGYIWCRYNRHNKRYKLPKWILQFLFDEYLNLSTDTAIQHVKQFLRLMGQPIDQEALKSVLLSLEEIEKLAPAPLADDDAAAAESGGGGVAMLTEGNTVVAPK